MRIRQPFFQLILIASLCCLGSVKCSAANSQSSTLEEEFRLGCEAIQKNNLKESTKIFLNLSSTYPDTRVGELSSYYLGISYFYTNEFDLANEAFSTYLKSSCSQECFESTVEYKLAIANALSSGSLKRCFGKRYLPKIAPAFELSLQIYDEVITTLPCHELAAMSLYSKGNALWKERFYGESIEAFQQLIRRFPKHELAPESYLAISCVLLEQCDRELHNSDLLAFAQINLKKFQQDFPKEERIAAVEANYISMQELYAQSLYQTAEYYQRKGKPGASVIYYQNVLDRFPETQHAEICKRELQPMGNEEQTE